MDGIFKFALFDARFIMKQTKKKLFARQSRHHIQLKEQVIDAFNIFAQEQLLIALLPPRSIPHNVLQLFVARKNEMK